MRILIIGAGAVGGYFGARLTAANRDVTFLVRERRAAQLRANGLHVTAPKDTFSVTPKLLLASDLPSTTPFDLILVSTKSYQLAAAMDDFAPAVGPFTTILPLLNGLAHIDTLSARFGPAAIVGGSTRIVADLDPDGHIHSMDSFHDLNYGEIDKQITPRIQAIHATLSGAGFEAFLQPDILAFMWLKWVFLASLGAITCLLRGSIGQVVAAPGGLATANAIVAEADAIATANGYPTPAPFLQALSARLFKTGSPLTASMFRDMIKGAPVEAPHILGDLLARGHAHNVPTPILQAAFAQLSVYSAAPPKA